MDEEGKKYKVAYCSDIYQVSSPVTMSKARGVLPTSNFLSMWVHQSTLPRFCSSPRLLSIQRAQRFLTPRQSWRMRVRLPDENFMISCISAFVILWSILIRHSTLETFSVVSVIASRPQWSSSSNVLAPDMNCLNHLKTVALDGDWSPKQRFKLWKHSWKKNSLAVLIIHQSPKIPLRKVNTAGRRPETLTGHFVAWDENGCTASSKFFLVTSIMKLVCIAM